MKTETLINFGLAYKSVWREVTPEGLTELSCLILLLIGERPEISQKAIAATLKRDAMTINISLRGLVDGGYVKTRRSRSDKRVSVNELTSTGKRVVQGIERRAKALPTPSSESGLAILADRDG